MRESETCPFEELEISPFNELKEILWSGVSPSVFFQKLRDVKIMDCP